MGTGSCWNRKELSRIHKLLSHAGEKHRESVAPSKAMVGLHDLRGLFQP